MGTSRGPASATIMSTQCLVTATAEALVLGFAQLQKWTERALMKHKTNHQHLCSVTLWMWSGAQLFSQMAWVCKQLHTCSETTGKTLAKEKEWHVLCTNVEFLATGNRDWWPKWPLHHRVTDTVLSVSASAAAAQQTEGQQGSFCHTNPGL